VEQRSYSEDNIENAGEEIPSKFFATYMFNKFSQKLTTVPCLQAEYFGTNPHIILF